MTPEEIRVFRRECAPHLYYGEPFSEAELAAASNIGAILWDLHIDHLRAEQIIRRAIDVMYFRKAVDGEL